MLGLIKEIFMRLLISIVIASNHTKCVSLRNQKCEIQPTFINLHLDECSEEFHYYAFTVKLNELKTLTKQISCECKCKFDGRYCNSDQWWNNAKCRCECKKRHVCEKDYVLNPDTVNC